MKYGFLFGAGAEIEYGLPLGGKFALDIFRQDVTNAKQRFREMRDAVDISSAYANKWLPSDYKTKSINSFGKSVFQNIIMSTVEHRRDQIIEKVNGFDQVASKLVYQMEENDELNVDLAFEHITGRPIGDAYMMQVVSYNDAFKRGNELFNSNYFSGLLLAYKEKASDDRAPLLRKILMSIMQLHLGALSEDLSRNITDNLFSKKDEDIDFFDDFGGLITLDYSSVGVSGLELLLEPTKIASNDDFDTILKLALQSIEDIYASVLDYKSLIDANWHYLYSPSSDWSKFCKISIFLLTVHEYIRNLGEKAEKDKPRGYYNVLKKTLDSGRYEASAIATTNYNHLIDDILDMPITHLNGSVETWYDPYLNKILKSDDFEEHICVPLIFTQSGTKPMTSIKMSEQYVDLYRKWKESEAIVVVGFGFGNDDEHINGILRTLVNDDNKKLFVVKPTEGSKTDNEFAQEIADKLKVNRNNIKVFLVDKTGHIDGKPWSERISE